MQEQSIWCKLDMDNKYNNPNMMKKNILLIFSVLALSCADEKGDFASLPSVPISGVHFEEELIATTASEINVVGSSIFVSDFNSPDTIISILDEETGKVIKRIGTRGGGPGEFTNLRFMGKSSGNDTIYIANIPNRIYTYARTGEEMYELIKENKIYLKKFEFPMGLHRLENGYYVMSTLSGGQDFFILLNSDCQEVKRFGVHPVKGMTADACDFIPFDGHMASYKNSFYYVTYKYGYIARYDISDSGETVLVWEKLLSEPQASISEANIQMRSSVNLSGFYGVTANDDYVFTTYSGIVYRAFIDQNDPSACTPRTLVVFDAKNGDVIGKYGIPNKSMGVSLSEDNERLYVFNTQPEVAIERFNVEDILNAE